MKTWILLAVQYDAEDLLEALDHGKNLATSIQEQFDNQVTLLNTIPGE